MKLKKNPLGSANAYLGSPDLRVVVDALSVGRVSAEGPHDRLGVPPQTMRPNLEPSERGAAHRPQGDWINKQ